MVNSLANALETKIPIFANQTLKHFENNPILTDVFPAISLLLNYFRLESIQDGNLSVRQ